MKRILYFIAVLATATVGVLSATESSAQNMQLPDDPQVLTGKLDNGMTYYIRHNDKPAGRAEFYLATNVGAIQETPDQDGLAHFLEHMCFNGTKNFPGKDLLNYLQSIGASFGGNINAATGVEQTQYMLNNIPLTREGVLDTCLLIIHDYSHFVTNSPEEIDKERGVIIEERRSRRTADWRMFEKSLPYLYGDSKYSTCTLIGSQDNLLNFKPESLNNFYHTWYRPDLQAIVVVGDIDPQKVLGKIKTVFADIPAAKDPKPKAVINIPNNQAPVVGIVTDPEATTSKVEVLWKSDAQPEEMNSTLMGEFSEIIKSLIGSIMNERFTDITSKADAPYLTASLGIGKLVETEEAVMGTVVCHEGDAVNGFKSYLTEVEKMRRYGFTDAEVQRAITNLESSYEEAANKADTRKNPQFIDPIINNFFDNYAYMEPKTEYELVKGICGQINAKILNQVAAQVITDTNMVVIYSGPEKQGLVNPTKEQFLQAIQDVKNADIQANADEKVDAQLLDPSKLKGSKVKTTKTTVYGATEWTLKNGVKVIVLPTDYQKDEILFNMYKYGGRSLIPTEDLPSFDDNIFGLYLSNTGVAGFSGTTLSKMLTGKNLSVAPYIDALRNGIQGSSCKKDLETAFQLMYLFYTEPRFDKEEYNNGIKRLEAILPNLQKQSSYKFYQAMYSTLYGNNPRKSFISEETLSKANLQTLEKDYKALFGNASGEVMIITGDVDLATLKPFVEKYIGSIPAKGKATTWKDTNEELVKGVITKDIAEDMETPKNTVLQVYSMPAAYNSDNSAALTAVEYILNMRYVESLREDEGGTYGASVDSDLKKWPKEQATLEVMFECKPSLATKLCKLAVDGMKDLATNGPTEEEVSRAVLNAQKNIPENRIKNGYWMGCIDAFYTYNYDKDQTHEAAVKALDATKIKAMAAQLEDSGNFIQLVLSPAKTAEKE